MNTLLIDTSNNKKTVVGLRMGEALEVMEQESTVWKSQAVLPLITTLLEKHNLTLSDISAIDVNPGPGSFTGLRVGVAIANALSRWLQIPVNGKSLGEIVEPEYT